MKFGITFQIDEKLVDEIVDKAREAKRFWTFRKFLRRPRVDEIIVRGDSTNDRLTRNVQLLQFAVIGLTNLRLSREEARRALMLLLRKEDNSGAEAPVRLN